MIRDTRTIAHIEKKEGRQDSLPEEAKFLMSNYEKLMSSKVKIQVLLEKYSFIVGIICPLLIFRLLKRTYHGNF